jgi:DNA-directed RNA polymerase subunit omega
MDAHVVLDCHKVLPNRFALTLAAAARTRALSRGAEPRLDMDDASLSDLALHEIAAGVFTQNELVPFLSGAADRPSLLPPGSGSKLCVGGPERTAAAPASRPRETVQ